MSGSNARAFLVIGGMAAFGVALGALGLTVVTHLQSTSSEPSSNAAATETATPAIDNQAAQAQAAADAEVLAEEEKQRAFEMIEEMAAHPDDPQNARGVAGVSDEDLAAMPFGNIEDLFERTSYYADANAVEQPQYVFALGRAALHHGETDLAYELLTKAAENGSAVAEAHLAYMTEDRDERIGHLQVAIRGGFEPAEAWLDEIEQEIAREQEEIERQRAAAAFDPNQQNFNRGDIISAFHSGQTAHLNNSLLENVTYAKAMQDFFADRKEVLFVTDNREILLEIDPSLSHQAQVKLTSSRQGMNDMMNAGLQSSPLAGLIAAMGVRKSGGSVMDEVNAATSAMVNTPVARLEVLKQQAQQDAARLAIIYDSNPDAFRKVYAGLAKFIQE